MRGQYHFELDKFRLDHACAHNSEHAYCIANHPTTRRLLHRLAENKGTYDLLADICGALWFVNNGITDYRPNIADAKKVCSLPF